jgi:hypothetical protein
MSFGMIANAETYKCTKGGQTIYSDTSCSAGASKVDAFSDKLSNDQRLQAEFVQQNNRKTLSEIEYQEARDRETRNRAAYNRALQERYSNNRSTAGSR